MVLKPDQQRIKELLSETITLLCCNGLHFKAEFSIDALIGITLDQDEVFLVSIKETFHNNKAHLHKKQSCSSEIRNTIANFSSNSSTVLGSLVMNDGEDCEAGVAELGESRMEVLEDTDGSGEYIHKNFAQNRSILNNNRSVNRRKRRRKPLRYDLVKNDPVDYETPDQQAEGGILKKMFDSSFSNQDNSFGSNVDNCYSSAADCFGSGFYSNMEGTVDKIRDNIDSESRVNPIESNTPCDSDVRHESSDKGEAFVHNGDDLVLVKQEPLEKRLLPIRKMFSLQSEEDLSRRHFRTKIPVTSLSTTYFQDSAGCSSWKFSESSNVVHMPFVNRQRWHLEPVEPQMSEREVESVSEDVTHLSVKELAIARAILSMRGNFVSLGCLKANRQCLRNYTREQLIEIMEKISSPLDPSLFIGMLYTFGTTRVFFKCPPSAVTPTALNYFGYDLVTYSECYHDPVIVDKNIRDPGSWIEKILDRSPFK